MLLLASLGWLLSLGSLDEPTDELSQSLQIVLNRVDMIGNVNIIVSIIVLIFALYMTSQFDQFIRVAKPLKPYDYNDTMRDDATALRIERQKREDEWRLK
jgi:hypothetical protein